ncbi:MAG: DUF4180 domain-containing protein [Defluviitaleaceae bacterium]|nr:DUF4180 domain-containing protein [Defluviitaleaceae bacterium]
MDLRVVDGGKEKIALCNSEEVVIFDGQSALDFFATIEYQHNCIWIAINKSAVCEGFFDLTTGIAGEVAQKFVNYGIRFAIYGDFSGYTSKALNDYIYECNKNGPLYFVADEDDAMAKLRE